jgi:outer membrane protein
VKRKKDMKKLYMSAVVSASIAFAASDSAFAQSSEFAFEIPGVRNFVAGAAGFVPDYLGSDDYRFGAAPMGVIRFGDTNRYARLVVTDLNINIIDHENWSFGPAVNWRFGRSDVDDKAVDDMRDIDGTLEVGAFGGWTWVSEADPRHRFAVGTEFLYDALGEHDGYLISGSVRYFQPVARPLTLSIGASLTYGSNDYMETYFGVDAGNVGSSGLGAFDADGGFRDVRVPLVAILSFSEKWHVAGGVIYSRLLGDAADSPVVDKRGSKNQFFAGLGIAYAW